jgi:hypothetical protein
VTGAVVPLPVRRVRACSRFDDGLRASAKFCAACGLARALHVRVADCSQCGGQFPSASGAGFSHCTQHRR